MNKQEITAALQQIVGVQVLTDAPMSSYTSWKIGGPADWLVMPSDETELSNVLNFVHEQELPWMVIGNGTNLLVADKGIRGVVIRIAEPFSGSLWRGDEVEASAGMLLNSLALQAAERSLTGLEFARGIPGSVGGGVRMNAGAFGHALGEFVTRVDGIAYDGTPVSLPCEKMSFFYRNSSLFQLDAVVTKIHLKLSAGDRDEIMERMKEYTRRRNLTQPLEYPSCGSVFRNPPDGYAGYLIEQADLRGTKCGGVEVSEKHGNFIINRRGEARAEDATTLIKYIQSAIHEFAGIDLEPEVKFVGDFD